MRRRRYLYALGATTAAATAVGTGAFTRIGADRDADVAVVADTDAYLTMVPTDEYFGLDFIPYVTSDTDAGVIAFSFTDDVVDGAGLNGDGSYLFHGAPAADDHPVTYTSLFTVVNDGPNDVVFRQTDDVGGDVEVRIVSEEMDGGEGTGNFVDSIDDVSGWLLEPGVAGGFGLRIDTTGVDTPFGDTVELPIEAVETDAVTGLDADDTQLDGVEAGSPAPAE